MAGAIHDQTRLFTLDNYIEALNAKQLGRGTTKRHLTLPVSDLYLCGLVCCTRKIAAANVFRTVKSSHMNGDIYHKEFNHWNQ